MNKKQAKTKAERREHKKRQKMKVSGRGVKELRKLIIKKSKSEP